MYRFSFLYFLLFTLSSLTWSSPVRAQDNKKEFAPTKVDLSKPTRRKVNLGPAGPRFDSRKVIQQRESAKLERLNKSVEVKLIRMIRNAQDNNSKKPEYLNRLAMFYWQQAGEQVTKGYQAEERCFEASSQNEDDALRCQQQRKQVEREAEAIRNKAIKVYQAIVKNYPNYSKIDEILFALGFNYQQKEMWQDAEIVYTEIVNKFPQSDRLPDVLFNLGEINFALSDVDEAAELDAASQSEDADNGVGSHDEVGTQA